MNPEVKAKWLAALRSGEYQQGTGTLRARGRYCCLGVLCDIYSREHGIEWGELDPIDWEMKFLGEDCFLPAPVIKWAGLSDYDPNLRIGGRGTCASRHNDGDAVPARTFSEIADAIEEQL